MAQQDPLGQRVWTRSAFRASSRLSAFVALLATFGLGIGALVLVTTTASSATAKTTTTTVPKTTTTVAPTTTTTTVAPTTTTTVVPPKSCSSPVHYSVTSNTIYLATAPPTGGAWTLSEIKAVCPQVPLVEVDPVNEVWELSADLIVQDGQTLDLHGATASVPGDVNTLRIQSGSDQLPTDVHMISVDYGTLNVDSVTVTSWNDAANAPQTAWQLPSSAPSTDRGRAFVRAESYLDPVTGLDDESTMTINDSTFEYLGYYGSESYGVSWKAEGCSHLTPAVCQNVQVTGGETDSVFEYDYMGSYTWGANDMTFSGNQYYDNVMYGLDTHDVSRNLLITDNHSSYNGDHGIICAAGCSNLTITDNTVDHNGLVPWAGPNPDLDIKGRVHGIMLYEGITNSVIEDNDVYDQPNGAAIDLYDTSNELVSGNQITDNLYGLKVSEGADDNLFTDNTITDDTQYLPGFVPDYAIYAYTGSQPTEYSPNSSPTGNVFDSDTFNLGRLGSSPIKITSAPGTVVSNSTFVGTNGTIQESSCAGSSFVNDVFPTGQEFEISGTSTSAGGVTVTGDSLPVGISVDEYSTASFTSPTGYLYGVTKKTLINTVSPTGSAVTLTSSALGTTGAVTLSRSNVEVLSSAAATASIVVSGGMVSVSTATTRAGTSLGFTVAGLTSLGRYTVLRNGVSLTTVVASTTGTATFSDAPPLPGAWVYSL